MGKIFDQKFTLRSFSTQLSSITKSKHRLPISYDSYLIKDFPGTKCHLEFFIINDRLEDNQPFLYAFLMLHPKCEDGRKFKFTISVLNEFGEKFNTMEWDLEQDDFSRVIDWYRYSSCECLLDPKLSPANLLTIWCEIVETNGN